ncbi:MAG TPA: D-aminoacyl-tRNA deacylase [Tepidisphaeraceae bacterium]|jgi:D-tyrosyl-tRNA(Tyr) deacylase
MIAVIQRVLEASVVVEGEIIGKIGPGLLVLAAIQPGDSEKQLAWMAGKITSLRIFRNGEKHFDVDVQQIGGEILLVSQFTLAADATQGRRPSFIGAAKPEEAELLFARFVEIVRATGVPTQTGKFAADMKVALMNDGPATFILRTD